MTSLAKIGFTLIDLESLGAQKRKNLNISLCNRFAGFLNGIEFKTKVYRFQSSPFSTGKVHGSTFVESPK